MVTKIKKQSVEGGAGETFKVIIQALILALILRTLIIQPFSIPSGSMKSSLLVGDYLFVSKYSYGYSRYSIPYGIIPFSGRFFGSEPERGDIAVFRLPSDPSTDYIKRVIGLPGDTVQMVDGIVILNGKPLKRERVEEFVEPTGTLSEPVMQFRETLPSGKTYMTLDLVSNGFADNTPEFKVPEGQYFMMGDNRDNSQDSRYLNVGFVPYDYFIGRAEFLFFSVSEGASAWQIWKWPTHLRIDRLFEGLRASR